MTKSSLRETAAAIWQWDVLNRPRPRVGTGANPERMLDAIEQALLLIDALAPPTATASATAAAVSSIDTIAITTRQNDDYDDSNNNDDAVAEDRRQDAMTVLVTGLRDYNDAPEQFQDYIFDRLHDQLDVTEQLYVNSIMIRPPFLDDDEIGTMMPHEGAVVHRFWSRGLDDLDGIYSRKRHRGGGGGGRRLSSSYNDEFEEAGDDEYYEEEGNDDQAWLHQQLQEQERFAVRSYVDRIPDTDTVTDYDDYESDNNNVDDDNDDDDDQLRLEDVLRTNLAKVLASTLTSQQLQVLQHVYGLQGGTTTTTTTGTTGSLLLPSPPPPTPLTVDETAMKLGLSRPRVERLLDRALTRLRRAFAEMYLSSGEGDGGHHRRIQHDDDDNNKKKMEHEEEDDEDSMIFEEDST
jgi:hypothetical protein